MAGILGAISLQSLFYLILTIWHLQSMKIEIPLRCKSTTSQSRKIFSLAFRMAQAVETQNGNPEIKEPTPKIQKLHNNGVSHEIVSFLRVKKLSDKASLPSRASLLSAGYDLSRYFCFSLDHFWIIRIERIMLFLFYSYSATETKVPARGKALIPTDLSIAIPERTYARIGNFFP